MTQNMGTADRLIRYLAFGLSARKRPSGPSSAA
jgi:hypothetical protein